MAWLYLLVIIITYHKIKFLKGAIEKPAAISVEKKVFLGVPEAVISAAVNKQ